MNNCENLLIFKHTKSFFLRTTLTFGRCYYYVPGANWLPRIITFQPHITLRGGPDFQRNEVRMIAQDPRSGQEQSRDLNPAKAYPGIVNGGLFRLRWGLARVSCDSSPVPIPLPLSLGFVEAEFVFYLFFHFP